jgi:hypothetical protein
VKVRHLKRRLASVGMQRMVSTYILRQTLRNHGRLNNTQRRLLRYRDFWK